MKIWLNRSSPVTVFRGLRTRRLLAATVSGTRAFSQRTGEPRACHADIETETTIKQITEVSTGHLTPEIKLHLVTQNCLLWHSRGDNSPFPDPFWAFYWPGGQVLSRFLLDKTSHVAGQTVLDVGSGCGASSIACKMAGAQTVTANDVDPVALVAVNMNARLNSVSVDSTNSCNLIGQDCSDWSTILLGDMFYSEKFADSLLPWLLQLRDIHDKNIFIGDPGRLPLLQHPIKSHLRKVFECELPVSCREENNGLSSGFVWYLGNESL